MQTPQMNQSGNWLSINFFMFSLPDVKCYRILIIVCVDSTILYLFPKHKYHVNHDCDQEKSTLANSHINCLLNKEKSASEHFFLGHNLCTS